MAIQILQDIELNGGIKFTDANADFPASPSIGTMILKGTSLYAYLTIGGMETWYPFANRTNSYVHTQGAANTVWTINHQLHTTDVWVQVKDTDGKVVSANAVVIDEDTISITFTTAMIGTAVVVAPSSIDVPEVKATLITVGSAVVIDSNGVKINGSYALTSASISQQIADAIAVETTARTAADALKADKTYVDTTFAPASHSQAISTITGLQTALDGKIDESAAGVSLATLVAGKVPSGQLPSYVDDVIEVADFAALPGTGESGKIYLVLDTLKQYRWSGSAYANIPTGAVDSVAGRTGVVTLTKSDVGLPNVDNTADSAKAVLSATKLATARTISLTGDVTGSTSFDGSGNVSITTTAASTYTLPVASSTVLGGIKDGTGITIDGTGVASVDYGSVSGTAVQGNDARVTADQAAGTASIRTIGTGALQAAAGDHNHTVNGLSNVNIVSITDNEVLAWDATSSKWINQTPAEAGLQPAFTTLDVASGGTGVATISGLVKGNGTSAFTSATVRTDYAEPTTALATGLLKNTTTTGAHTIAQAGTDYMAPASTINLGTTNFALNRASATQSLTGVNIDGTAGVATATTVTDDVATATTVYPSWVAAASGNNTQKVSSTKFSFVPSTGILTATGFAGSGASLTALNASNISSGTVATARLGSGTADSTSYLRGDGTWQVVSSGATLSDDTTTNATYYPTFATATSGAMTTAKVASTKLSFNPSTGQLNATVFNSTSDRNAKDNIQPIVGALGIVNRINGYSFNWIGTSDKSYGYIAQEIEQVLPDVVSTDAEGRKSVNYDATIAILLEAIKELSAKVDLLQNK